MEARSVDYQVTISEELRALVRNRGSSAIPVVPVPHSSPRRHPRIDDGSRDVFTDLRLRVDGQRPLRLRAAEVLCLDDDAVPHRTAGGLHQTSDRFSTVTLYLTEEDECVMHVAVEPPGDCSVRPIYGCSIVSTANDVDALLGSVRKNFEAQVAVAKSTAWRGSESQVETAEPCCPNQIARGIEPFLVTPINGR